MLPCRIMVYRMHYYSSAVLRTNVEMYKRCPVNLDCLLVIMLNRKLLLTKSKTLYNSSIKMSSFYIDHQKLKPTFIFVMMHFYTKINEVQPHGFII